MKSLHLFLLACLSLQCALAVDVNCVGSYVLIPGTCAVTCGGSGTGTYQYRVTVPLQGAGQPCRDLDTNAIVTDGTVGVKICGNTACNVDCAGYWASTTCSSTCGDGTKTLTFTMLASQSGTGRPCSIGFGATRTESCALEPCPVCGDGVISWNNGEQCDPPGGCCGRNCRFMAINAICRTARNSCDRDETCSGITATCPKNSWLPDHTRCSPGFPTTDYYQCMSGHCLKSRVCGNNKVEHGEECDPPSDCCTNKCQFTPATVQCRSPTQFCDAAEYCTGYSGDCPANRNKLDGARCALAGYNGEAVCQAGSCIVKPDRPATSSTTADLKLRDLLRDAYKELAGQH